MSDKLQAFLDAAEARAKHGTCLHSHDIEALVPIVKAFAAVVEEAEGASSFLENHPGFSGLRDKLAAARAAVAALSEEEKE